MDLYIKFDNGSMAVHLDAFLDCRNIGKVKKLVKLIQHSYTPGELAKMKEFVEQQLEQFEPRMQEDTIYISGYKPKLKFSEQNLEKCLHNRDRYKRGTDGWAHYNELVKEFRQEIREIKAAIRSKNSDFNGCIRNKAFYEKVLENIT